MRTYNIKLKFITPCISQGARSINSEPEKSQAELRAPSIRGALRFWFRAIGGSKQREKELFGGIGKERGEERKSQIIVRVKQGPKDEDKRCEYPNDIADPERAPKQQPDYFLGIWEQNQEKPYIPAGEEATIQIIDKSDSPDFEQALQAFLYLGSIGARSRRTYGSIYPESVVCNKEKWKIPQTLDEFKEYLENSGLKNATVIKIEKQAETNQQKRALANEEEAVDNAKKYLKKHRSKDKSSPEERVVLGLPFAGFYLTQSAKAEKPESSRWASPVLLKIIKLSKEKKTFIPIAVFLKDYFIPEEKEITQAGGEDATPKAQSKMPGKISRQLTEKMMTDGTRLFAS